MNETRWRKLAALGVLVAVLALVAIFHSRLAADFLPLDASRVGPNLIASLVVWAAVFICAVLLYPPLRRRVHRFIDGKLEPLHAKVTALHERHDEHKQHLDELAASVQKLHEKLDKRKEPT